LRPGSIVEDCRRAKVLIAAIPVRRDCESPELVIDRFDVLKGAATLTFANGGIHMETVTEIRSKRPWSPGKMRD